MVQRAGGFRMKTRRSMSKSPRNRGKISMTAMMQQFKEGDRVAIDQEPAFHAATPHPKFKGRVGTVIGMQGKAYKVEVWDGGVRKLFLSAPVHIRIV